MPCREICLDNLFETAANDFRQPEHILHYDGSFEGLLSAIFTVYAQKLSPIHVHLSSEPTNDSLFAHTQTVYTHPEHAQRVWKKIAELFGKRGTQQILYGVLSAAPEMPDTLLRLIARALSGSQKRNILLDYGDPDVMQWYFWVKKVGREKHHMEAFVRFEEYALTGDDTRYFIARIAPVFDILPLIAPHFRRRFRDQAWAIFDEARGYGIFAQEDKLQRIHGLMLGSDDVAMSPIEAHYQKLWRQYFQSTTIRSRINPKLQRQMMPQRYWRYLTEMQPEK